MRGGSERYMFELTRLLEKHGHDVIPFSMVHKDNLQLIAETNPHIVHIHGIGHEISPSILNVIKSYDIPIVQTLHDYGLLCPNTNFISRGKVCEQCKGRRYYHVVLRRCKRDSLGASLMACISHYAHTVTDVHERNLDVYISPSRFLHNKLKEYGINKKIVVVPNFIDLNNCPSGNESSGYCLYAGRLLAMKGIRTLIDAARLNRKSKILIAGDGELSDELRNVVAEQRLDNVTLLGHVEPGELMKLVAAANFTVFPSECYENYPMSIIESFACGKPVIASNIGALPDLVINDFNGLLFEPGNPNELASQIQYLFDHPHEATAMGKNGRNSILTINDPEVHYQQIMAVYRALLKPSAMTN
jgi:glycosyltransferase involved in cell wall biosynthesis